MKVLMLFFLFPLCFCWNGEHDKYMPAAAAAYSEDPSQCWSNIKKCFDDNDPRYTLTFTIYRQYTVQCNSFNDTCSAYIVIVNDTVVPYLTVLTVFRGTNNNYKFFENFYYFWNYNEMMPFVAGGKVGKVFLDGFNDLWNAGMKDNLLALKNKYSPNVNFNFLGHSIGGAMATLAAGTFKQLNSNYNVSLHTYGQPRVGDKNFSIAIDNFNFNPSYRITHKADIVPHLPPLNLSSYYHHSQELWYNNNMTAFDFDVCFGGEDTECSNSLPDSDFNMEDHKYYFNRDFIEYGKSGCPDLVTF